MANRREGTDPGLEKARGGNQQPGGTGAHATRRAEDERGHKDRKAEGIAGGRKGEVRGG